jgi:hypothetical protein
MDTLPSEIIEEILKRVSATGSSPADLCSPSCVSRAFRAATNDADVLRIANPGLMAVRAVWTPGPLEFLEKLWRNGSEDALYVAGMIRFYVTMEFGIGGEMLAKLAQRNHGPALYQCAIALINSSGGSGMKLDACPEGANELLFRAAMLGYVPAGVELGWRMMRGRGFPKKVALGSKVVRLTRAGKFGEAQVLLEICLRKAHFPFSSSFLPASFVVDWSRKSTPTTVPEATRRGWTTLTNAAHETLLANAAMRAVAVDVFACANPRCGRAAFHRDEFSRCPECKDIQYCSLVCEIRDRKRHVEYECE